MRKKAAVIAIALAASLTFTGCGEQKKYDDAMSLMEEGKYEEAITELEEIQDFNDAADQINQCKYNIADDLYSSKKYDDAITQFEEIKDYKDAADRINQCKYDKAVGLYDDLDFESALEIFKEITDYEDSSDYVEKCEYELSVDGQFMRALSNALMDRWDYSDDPDNATESEDKLREKCCDIELEALKSFYDQTFDDADLQDIAKDYIDTVNTAKESLTYYTVNSMKYYNDWNTAYQHRTILLEQFVNDYGLTVDEDHQETLDDLLTDAQASKEQVKLDEQVEDIVKTIKITSSTDEWGFVTYKYTMENTSDYTFDYFYVTVNAEDSDDTIVSTGGISAPASWAPGKKVSGDTYFTSDVDLDSVTLEFDVSYTSGDFYKS